MNLTIKIQGTILSAKMIGHYSLWAEPEESMVSIVDRIDTNLRDFKVLNIKITDERVPCWAVEICGDDGVWEEAEWLPNSMGYENANNEAKGLRRQDVQWARIVEVK